jgi:tRNA dimethylallyltransferase
LLEETAMLRDRFGDDCHALTSLGYSQAMGVLRGELALPNAITAAQQGHRNYAKRQLTWFRGLPAMNWLYGFGDDPRIQSEALDLATQTLSL